MWNILVHRVILRLASALCSAVSDECVSCHTLPFLISFQRQKCKTLELLLVGPNPDICVQRSGQRQEKGKLEVLQKKVTNIKWIFCS